MSRAAPLAGAARREYRRWLRALRDCGLLRVRGKDGVGQPEGLLALFDRSLADFRRVPAGDLPGIAEAGGEPAFDWWLTPGGRLMADSMEPLRTIGVVA